MRRFQILRLFAKFIAKQQNKVLHVILAMLPHWNRHCDSYAHSVAISETWKVQNCLKASFKAPTTLLKLIKFNT